jgi:RNA polymerase sigma-70 factor (ECF subfamily)
MALLDQVIAQLQQEYEAAGEGSAFRQLKTFLTIETNGASYAEAEAALGLSPGAARVAVHRLRKRYRASLRHEIAQTLADPAQVDEEMQTLFEAFRA